MTATVGTLAAPGTLAAILKEFYLGPVQEQLNNEVMVLELMQKTTVDWNGKVAIIPVHLDRNSGVGYRAEGGTLPTAGQQGFNRLQITSAYLYGRFQVTGPAMASAGKGGPNSFIGWMDAEMKKLVTDVKNEADRSMVSGGRVLGFINEHENKTNAAGAMTYEFFGDLEKLQTLSNIAANLAAPVDLRIEFIRMDTYATIATWGGAGAFGDLQSAGTPFDLANRTFTMRANAVNDLDLTGLPDGVAVAVRMPDTQGNAPADVAIEAVIGTQPTGIFGNIAEPTHFTVDRTTATNTATALQSTAITMATAGNHDRADIGLTRIQSVMDTVLNTSGTEPNIILMNPLQRQKYAALFQLTAGASNAVQNVSGEKSGAFNGGFSGLSYGNMPLKTSRHVANGGLIFLKTDTWKLLELQPHGFADVDGDVLLRVQNQDSYEGYYRWYYNTVCVQPNRNAILAGLTLL